MPTIPTSVFPVTVVRAPLTILSKGVNGYEEVECKVREVAWI